MSLYNCFIVEKKDGEVKWTDHGAQCGICLEEVKDVKQMVSEGKSLEEIQNFINTTFGGNSQATNPASFK